MSIPSHRACRPCPAGKAAEFGCRSDIGAAGKERIKRDVAVIEGFEAGFKVVFLEHLALGCDHERREQSVNPGGRWNLLERGAAGNRHCQDINPGPKGYAKGASGHALRAYRASHPLSLRSHSVSIYPSQLRGRMLAAPR